MQLENRVAIVVDYVGRPEAARSAVESAVAWAGAVSSEMFWLMAES